MKAIGILLIVGSILATAWWVLTEHPHKLGALGVLLVAVFAGLCLVFSDRAIEISLKNVGTIKAAAQQATVDAQAIAEMKNRIENQSATISLVADSAVKAHELIEDVERKNAASEKKLDDLKAKSEKAKQTIAQLKETSRFFTTMTTAQCDSRHAFNALVDWAENTSSPYWQLAANTAVQIRVQFAGPMEPGYMNIPMPDVPDSSDLPLDILTIQYRQAVQIYKPHLIHLIWESSHISKKDKMTFFVNVLHDDKSLTATYYAGKFFAQGTSDPNLKWEPFNIQPLLDWWEKNKDKL